MLVFPGSKAFCNSWDKVESLENKGDAHTPRNIPKGVMVGEKERVNSFLLALPSAPGIFPLST